MNTYVSLCAFIACQGCGYSSSSPRRYAIRAAGEAGWGSVDLSPAEMSVSWWEDEQSWGHLAAWGGLPWGEPAGLGGGRPRGEGLYQTRLPWGPLPQNDALMQPELSFGSGLEDVGLFCHVLEGTVVRLCRAGGHERMPGSIFREVFFFFPLNCDSVLVSAPVQSRSRSPQT